jgi:replication-associated recombination protein RarA
MTCEDIGLANPELPSQIIALHSMWEKIAESNIEEASMPLIQSIMLLCRSHKNRIIDHYKIWLLKTDYNPEIPDYALDVHTRRGKIMGRNHKYFLEHGRKVNNEIEIDADPEIMNFYDIYLTDYAEKRVEITGYDKRNVTHKSTKDMEQWKRENSQTKMFE